MPHYTPYQRRKIAEYYARKRRSPSATPNLDRAMYAHNQQEALKAMVISSQRPAPLKTKIPDVVITAEWNCKHDSCYDDADLEELFAGGVPLSRCMSFRGVQHRLANRTWATVPFGDRTQFILQNALVELKVSYQDFTEAWAIRTEEFFLETIDSHTAALLKAKSGVPVIKWGGKKVHPAHHALLGSQAPAAYLCRMWGDEFHDNEACLKAGVDFVTKPIVDNAFLTFLE